LRPYCLPLRSSLLACRHRTCVLARGSVRRVRGVHQLLLPVKKGGNSSKFPGYGRLYGGPGYKAFRMRSALLFLRTWMDCWLHCPLIPFAVTVILPEIWSSPVLAGLLMINIQKDSFRNTRYLRQSEKLVLTVALQRIDLCIFKMSLISCTLRARDDKLSLSFARAASWST